MIRSFNGKTPKIADSAFVSEAAYIIGDVEIGDNSSVWPGAVIRADFGKIKIGEDCAVEDNCMLHSTPDSLTIGNNVHIGHGAVINCHEIGEKVLVGMNATLLHGAKIGSLCVIGANCLVGQGMEIPDKSFVAGVPGKVKAEVTAQQLLWATEGSKVYAKLAKEYKEHGL